MCTFIRKTLNFLLIYLFHVAGSVYLENVIGKFSSEVGAGNFSYYKLREPGDITLLLYSRMGDADLYVSEQISEPNFENYNLSSTTCGLDAVVIPSSFKRPTYVSIYGHVHSPISKYTLLALLNQTGSENPDGIIDDQSYGYFDVPPSLSDDQSSYFSSVVWEILETLFKILLEILL